MAGMRDHFHFHHDIVANASRLVHHLHKRCPPFGSCSIGFCLVPGQSKACCSGMSSALA